MSTLADTVHEIIMEAARIVGVPTYRVEVSFQYNRPDDPDEPDALVLRITVLSDFMFGRGRHRQHSRLFGSGVGEDCVREALDDLIGDYARRLAEQKETPRQ
jgi:hypothetical protein